MVKLRVGPPVRVLDPVSCLLTKVDVLERETARNADGTRNDALHVRLLIRVVPAFLQFLADSKHERWAADVARSMPTLARAEQVLTTFEAARDRHRQR